MTSRRAGGLLAGVSMLVALLAVVSPAPATAAAGDITTYAGSLGEGPALHVAQRVRGMAARGNLIYMADEAKHVVRVLDVTTGIQRIVAGNGTADGNGPDSLGDGGPATSASLGYVGPMTFDAAGNLYIADSYHFYLRKLEPSGRITIVAGNGTRGDTGDGGPARSASLGYMWGLGFDGAGNLYVSTNTRIRKIDVNGRITTAAGTGTTDVEAGSSPDGTLATQANLNTHTVAVDPAGNLFFSDGLAPPKVRKVDTNGVLSTLTYTCATTLIFDPAGNLYGSGCDAVVKIDPAGTAIRVAGTGYHAASPDGSRAAWSSLAGPESLALDPAGNLYIAEASNYKVRKIDAAGILRTVAGNGTFSWGGDGGRATDGQFSTVTDVARDASGNLYVADWGNKRVRRIDPAGVLTTVAGNGQQGHSGDGGPATAAAIDYPSNVAVDGTGNLYIASYGAFRVRKVDRDGVITTIAGNGISGITGDGGPATSASIGYTGGLAVDASGSVYITDNGNHRIRKVDPAGIISTFAGTGEKGFGGDGGPATAARLHYPNGLALDAAGNLFVADTYNGRIRKIAADGRVSTFASVGSTLAITSDRAGGLFAGSYGKVVRISPVGSATVAGTGVPGFSGDDGPALQAQFSGVSGLAYDGADLFLTDTSNGRIRRVAAAGSVQPTTTTSSTTTTTMPTTTTTTPPPPGSRLFAIGLDHVGQVGGGTFSTRAPMTEPRAVGLTKATAAGYYHSLAVAADGRAWAWGWNHFGQLGEGSTLDRGVPVPVAGLSGVVSVAGGSTHSLALKGDGTVWAWGFNGVGQLGTATTTDSRVPVQVPGLTGVTAIAAGAFHSLALKSDGTVWSWGWNGFGGLGTGAVADRWSPGPVPGVSGVTSIAAGAYHSLAVKGDGSAWAWGWNAIGQLGNGSTVDARSPVRVQGLTGIVAVAGGMAHSLALNGNGEVLAWGWNALGQLGNGTVTDSRTPLLVVGGGVGDIAAGAYHSVVARPGNYPRAWGWNETGQIGAASALVLSPLDLVALPGVTDVAAGVGHTLAR